MINGISHEPSEPWMSDVLRKVLTVSDGAFLDVGVNLGQTLLKLRSLDPHRRYVGFEPNPVCVQYVHELLKRNGLACCTIIPAGLFSRDEVLTLNLYQDALTDASASIVAEFRQQSPLSRMFIPVFKWETVEPTVRQSRFGVVKIDVEGAELEVIQTLKSLLERDQPVVLLEVLPAYSADNKFRIDRQTELQRIFGTLGYMLMRVEKCGDQFAGLKPADLIAVHGDLEQCDYVAAPAVLFPALVAG